jgi:hypothetical protein
VTASWDNLRTGLPGDGEVRDPAEREVPTKGLARDLFLLQQKVTPRRILVSVHVSEKPCLYSCLSWHKPFPLCS